MEQNTTTLYFIRHAHSEANAGGVTKANKAIALSPQGQQQAQRLAKEFDLIEPKQIYVSEMLRTHQTAALLAQRFQLDCAVLPCLNEFTMLCHERAAGLTGAQRQPLAQAYWDKADPYFRYGTHADTFAEFYAATTRFIETLPKLPNNSLIFGHGIWMALLLWRIWGKSQQQPLAAEMQAFRQFQLLLPIPNTALYQLQWQPATKRLSGRYLRHY